MDIDKEIQDCLEKGEIMIGDHCWIFSAVLMAGNVELARCASDRGFEHLMMSFVAKVLGYEHMAREADTRYPYSLSLLSLKDKDRLIEKSSLGIYLTGNVVTIDHYCTMMTDLGAVPGRYNKRTGSESCFSEALEDVLRAHPVIHR